MARPARPARESVCLFRRAGREGGHPAVLTPRCDRSSWSPLFVIATVAATSLRNLTEGVGTDKSKGRHHQHLLVQDEDGGWWCLVEPEAAECALST